MSRKKSKVAEARHGLLKSKHVNSIYSVKSGETHEAIVSLPEEYEKARAADAELLSEAEQAEIFIAAAETGFLEREHGKEESVPIKAGSVLFVEHQVEASAKEFLKNNFLSHQIVDAQKIAAKLKTEVTDQAVGDVMKFIVKERARYNLTTVISYPSDFPFKSELDSAIRETALHYKTEIPTPEIRIVKNETEKEKIDPSLYPSFRTSITEDEAKNCGIDVDRDAPDNVPLFIVGDIQGCYKAMRELAGRVREENLNRDADAPKRQIVFVGDMADRGPYDAEAVIYITALVRSGRAMLIKGNHDENLLKGLMGEEIQSSETKETLRELKERLSQKSLEKIKDVLMEAPLYVEWKNLVVVHGALPRVPRPEQNIDDKQKKLMTHGAKKYDAPFAGRAEVYKLHETIAHDPEVLIVGGHSHEGTPELNRVSGSVNLDASVEMKGKLWGMYYPELEFASAEEPSVMRLYNMLRSESMPKNQDLPLFIEWARQQSLLETKNGHGEYAGLTLVTYSRVTEMGNLWETYPSLRHFRGLIIDKDGEIVARPFPKTHKAGEEIQLEKLDVVPSKVFEKANGSLGIAYFFGGRWRFATKFSFENESYTKPSEAMLSKMNTTTLDPDKTYLFEIILPNDSHIVDYGGRQELILLNIIDKKTGAHDNWDSVLETSEKLGARTAEDFTEQFQGMTIAQIYDYAQKDDNIKNLEGFMAIYTDPQTGTEVMVKVKAKEYSDKKFVRDYLDWESIIEAIDPNTMEISEADKEKLLRYNFDNNFARAALETRLQWIRAQYEKTVAEAKEFIFGPYSEAQKIYDDLTQKGEERPKAIELALRGTVPHLIKLLETRKGEARKSEMGALMSFMRNLISGQEQPEVTLAKYAINKAEKIIEEEIKKHGKNSFWVIPEESK
ncbi:MAG: metallophosphoesterase [Candidatus Sungbacteria bacterium]|nr:metallophosphoesterase [Candidatus Sungbacteria bacterium]